MSFFGPLFYFILALSLLVLVHEWGHFYVARRSGVRVLRFSIGFGPELLGWTRGDTRYSLSAIPFGGYVKFAGDNPEEERDETSDEFLSQSLGVRSAIVIAGPLMNYLLAIVLFAAALYFGGIETIGTTRIGMVEESSVAETVGIRADDVLRTINGEPVTDWYEVGVQLTEIGAGEAFEIEVEREGRTELLTGSAPPTRGFADTTLGVSPFAETLIGRVHSDGPASEAGLRAGDRILTVDGQPVDRWDGDGGDHPRPPRRRGHDRVGARRGTRRRGGDPAGRRDSHGERHGEDRPDRDRAGRGAAPGRRRHRDRRRLGAHVVAHAHGGPAPAAHPEHDLQVPLPGRRRRGSGRTRSHCAAVRRGREPRHHHVPGDDGEHLHAARHLQPAADPGAGRGTSRALPRGVRDSPARRRSG